MSYLSFCEVIVIGDQFLANFMWSATELAGHPAVSGALCGGGARVALASRHYGVKVEIDAFSIHEVTVDYVVHITIQVFGEHVYVQVSGQSVLTAGEAGRSAEVTHPLHVCGGIGGPSMVGAHCWHRGVLGFESRELRRVLRHN